jgi:hypothetical protein
VAAVKTADDVTAVLLDQPAILGNMPASLDLLDPGRGDPCAGCSHTLVLVTYAAPQGLGDAEGGQIPLRCGRADVGGRDGWGYRHFVRRWVGVAERFHHDITAVLERGRRRRPDRTRVRYELAWSDARGGIDRAMTVIVGLRPQQPDLAIRGIVTAYWWDHPERAAHLLEAG